MATRDICSVDGCTTRARLSGGMCKRHISYSKGVFRFGDNLVIPDGEVSYIILTKMDGSEAGRVVIDTNQVERIKGRRWHLAGKYALSNRPYCVMHRLLTDAPSDLEVDHINGNGLDNRLDNLRLVTHAQNMQNRGTLSETGHRNVYRNRGRGADYSVQLTANGERIFGGHFDSLDEAVEAAKKLRAKHYSHAVEGRH